MRSSIQPAFPGRLPYADLLVCVLASACVGGAGDPAVGPDWPTASPESVGLDGALLDLVVSVLAGFYEDPENNWTPDAIVREYVLAGIQWSGVLLEL